MREIISEILDYIPFVANHRLEISISGFVLMFIILILATIVINLYED